MLAHPLRQRRDDRLPVGGVRVSHRQDLRDDLVVCDGETRVVDTDEGVRQQQRDSLVAVDARLALRERVQQRGRLRRQVRVLLVATPARPRRGERRLDDAAIAVCQRTRRRESEIALDPSTLARTLDDLRRGLEI